MSFTPSNPNKFIIDSSLKTVNGAGLSFFTNIPKCVYDCSSIRLFLSIYYFFLWNYFNFCDRDTCFSKTWFRANATIDESVASTRKIGVDLFFCRWNLVTAKSLAVLVYSLTLEVGFNNLP